MTIKKINFAYPRDSVQSVYSTEEMTALELSAVTSKKVDECVELVNGVEQSAIEATAVVDEMRMAQDQFMTENADIRAELVSSNQAFIEELETTVRNDLTQELDAFKDGLSQELDSFKGDMSQELDTFKGVISLDLNNFKSDLTVSKTAFENIMTAEVNSVVTNSEEIINNKVDELVDNGTMEYLLSQSMGLSESVYKLPLTWVDNTTISYANPSFQANADFSSTILQKIPIGGMRTTINPAYAFSTPRPLYRPYFFTKSGDNFIPASGYDYSFPDIEGSFISEGCYFPYQENVYFTIVVKDNGLNLSNFPDFVEVYGGKVKGNKGKLTNLTPVGVKHTNDTNLDIDLKTEYLPSLCNYYGSVVRLRDANAIYCSPKYSLIAQIYKINRGGTTELFETIVSSVTETKIDGVCVIDLDQYEFDGFCKLAIQCTTKLTSKNEQLNVVSSGMGICASYEEVFNNVFVEYKNGVNVTSEGYTENRIVGENIRFLTSLKFPTVASTHYDVDKDTTYPVPKMDKTALSWYGGHYYQDAFLFNETFKSIITSAQNPNSKYYIKANYLGYGMVCGVLTSLVHGLTAPYPVYQLAKRSIEGITVAPFNYLSDIDKLSIGDLLIMEQGPSGHVVVVTGKEYINGELCALNILEANYPFVRFRTYLNNEYYNLSLGSSNISDFLSLSQLSVFTHYGKVDHSIQNKVINQYNFDVDYSVGTIMCDRGTDGIYTALTASTIPINLTITDDSITSIKINRNGTFYKTINIADKAVTNANGFRVINIRTDISHAGYYTLIPNNKTTAQESFYVPDVTPKTVTKTMITEGENTGKYMLTFTDPSELAYVCLWYDYKNDANTAFYMVKATDIVNGQYIADIFEDTLDIINVVGIYKTDYGTYCVTSGGSKKVELV